MIRQPNDNPLEPVTHDGHGVRSVACPFCHAQPGVPCHSTAHGDEVHVHRDHEARFEAFRRHTA